MRAAVGIMGTRWKSEYLQRFAALWIVSIVAAALFVILSLRELMLVAFAAQKAEKLSEDAVSNALLTPLCFAGVFGLRLAYLAFNRLSLLGNFATFGICAVCSYVMTTFSLYGCVWNCDSSNAFPIYSLFTTFPLEMTSLAFVVLGTVKFAVISIIAMDGFRER